MEIIEQFTPLIIALLAMLPVLSLNAFNKKSEKLKPANYHWLIVYLICLVLAACVVVILKGVELMSVDNSDRSLFICSILAIACIDQCLNLLPVRTKLQFDLSGLLLYSIILLCGVPIVWQISRHIIPAEISSQTGGMRVTEIGLMLAMVILCVGNGFIKKARKKREVKQN